MIVAFVAPHGAFATAPSTHGTLITVRLVQLLKESDAIEVGVPLNVNVVKLEQLEKAVLTIVVTLSGKLVNANLVQP